MAVFALTNEHLTINSVDLSAWVKSAVLTLDAAQLDSTAMGDSWTEVTGGLKSGSLAITFNDDFAASAVSATLFPLFGTNATFIVRPVATAVSATNPNYTGSVFVAQYAVGGAVGELAAKSLTFPTSGTVSRATS